MRAPACANANPWMLAAAETPTSAVASEYIMQEPAELDRLLANHFETFVQRFQTPVFPEPLLRRNSAGLTDSHTTLAVRLLSDFWAGTSFFLFNFFGSGIATAQSFSICAIEVM